MSWRSVVMMGSAAAVVLAACGDRGGTREGGADVTLAFTDVAVVDVEAGAVLPDRTVLVAGDEIVRVGAASEVDVPGEAEVVEGSGRFLIPGLWDMHVHMAYDPETLGLYLANGVTGVREMGGQIDSIRATRAALRSGELDGPRVVWAGPAVDGPKEGIPWRLTVTDSAEGAAAVDSVIAMGFDFVKVHNGIAPEPFFALAARARERGIAVVGHPPPRVGLLDAVGAGMASVEHTTGVLEAGLPPEAARSLEAIEAGVDSFLGAAPDSLYPVMRREGTWYDPTLIAGVAAANRLDPSVESPPEQQYMPPGLQRFEEMWASTLPEGGVPPAVVEARHAVAELGETIAAAFHEAGIPLLAGTDVGLPGVVPGFALHGELDLLVESGLTPADALRAATVGPARFLGAADTLGTVAEGRKADLVLLAANPLEEIGNARRIEAVVRGGRLLDRAALDALLEEARSRAAGYAASSDSAGPGGAAPSPSR